MTNFHSGNDSATLISTPLSLCYATLLFRNRVRVMRKLRLFNILVGIGEDFGDRVTKLYQSFRADSSENILIILGS